MGYVATHAHNPRTWEAKAERFTEFEANLGYRAKPSHIHTYTNIYTQCHFPRILKTRRQSCCTNKMYQDTPTCMEHPGRGVYRGF